MDLCIKTVIMPALQKDIVGFNPCFNGSMYKNLLLVLITIFPIHCFNPCFNGSMYKNFSSI